MPPKTALVSCAVVTARISFDRSFRAEATSQRSTLASSQNPFTMTMRHAEAITCEKPPQGTRKIPQVKLFPRRKAGHNEVHEKGRPPVKVSVETIEAMFCMPQAAACKVLGISLTALKQVCRKLGITRWPYQRRKRDTRCHSNAKTPAAKTSASIAMSDTRTLPGAPALDALEVKHLAGCMSDSADSCSSAGTLDNDDSLPAVNNMSQSPSSAASAASHQDAAHQSVHVDSTYLASHADDGHDEHGLGWLVSCVEDSHPSRLAEEALMRWLVAGGGSQQPALRTAPSTSKAVDASRNQGVVELAGAETKEPPGGFP